MTWLKEKWQAAVLAFKADEVKLRRYVRGFLLWASAIVTQVLTVGIETASQWNLKQWGARLLVAAIAGLAGLINLGQMNAKPPAP